MAELMQNSNVANNIHWLTDGEGGLVLLRGYQPLSNTTYWASASADYKAVITNHPSGLNAYGRLLNVPPEVVSAGAIPLASLMRPIGLLTDDGPSADLTTELEDLSHWAGFYGKIGKSFTGNVTLPMKGMAPAWDMMKMSGEDFAQDPAYSAGTGTLYQGSGTIQSGSTEINQLFYTMTIFHPHSQHPDNLIRLFTFYRVQIDPSDLKLAFKRGEKGPTELKFIVTNVPVADQPTSSTHVLRVGKQTWDQTLFYQGDLLRVIGSASTVVSLALTDTGGALLGIADNAAKGKYVFFPGRTGAVAGSDTDANRYALAKITASSYATDVATLTIDVPLYAVPAAGEHVLILPAVSQ